MKGSKSEIIKELDETIASQDEKINELQQQIDAYLSGGDYLLVEYKGNDDPQFRAMKNLINIQARQLTMLRKKDYQEEMRSAKAVNNKLNEQLWVNERLTARVEELENKTC